MDKREHPEAYRELKVLHSHLGALSAKIEQHLKGVSSQKELAKIDSEKTKAMTKARNKDDEAGAKAAELEANLKKQLVTLSTQGKSAVKKALAAIQVIKSSLDVATYNTQMNNAGRDVSQWLLNIEKLKRHGKLGQLIRVQNLPDPAPFKTTAAAFGDGAKRRLDDATDARALAATLKEFSTYIKAVSTAYTDVLKGRA